MPVTRLSTVGDRAFPVAAARVCMEQSAGRCHFVASAVDIQETAEDRTVCSGLSIAPAASDTLLLTARMSFRFLSFLFCKVS